jgi:hypothetical protein
MVCDGLYIDPFPISVDIFGFTTTLETTTSGMVEPLILDYNHG